MTAVVRDPVRHAGTAAEGVRLVAGDVADPAAVAAAVAGHDAVISSVYRADTDARTLFEGAARALSAGLGHAGVKRLGVVGVAATLVGDSGARVLDTPGFPAAWREFCLGHAAGLEALRDTPSPVHWLVVNPPMELVEDGPRTGRYRLYDERLPPGGGRISHADFAVGVLDEVMTPRHHRTQLWHSGLTEGRGGPGGPGPITRFSWPTSAGSVRPD
ncbi:NAD(P)H-binding protein [Streptomyces sp. B1866]|nr:NAD(P)H-binding protein [Streptomyces sp. B1866]MDT3398731.1 NAD(P)H-binding protein [Streptomyces sp. B1866]